MLPKILFFVIFGAIITIRITNSELEVLGHCLKNSNKPNVLQCAGQQVLNSLQYLEDSDNFIITEGLIMKKEEGLRLGERSLPSFLDQDPMDFRGILENAGAVIRKRSLQWDLSRVYPGLSMKIGPTDENAAGSILEFVMDPDIDTNKRDYLNEETSTARILTQKFILPFLLALKFNLVAIVPILFAGVVFLCKKAAVLAKIALFISGLFGLGGALSLGAIAGGGGDFQHFSRPSLFGNGFGGHYGHIKPLGSGLGSYGDHHHGGGFFKNAGKPVYEEDPREFVEATVSPLPDYFYNYEKNLLMQDRNAKLHEKNGSPIDEAEFTVSSTADGDESAVDTSSLNYRAFAWKTV